MTRRTRGRRKRLLVMLAAWLAVASSVFALETAPEAAVRAALLFNFLKFTDWPMTPEASRLQVCVAVQEAEQYAAIEALAGRQVRGRTLAVQPLGAAAQCDVVYVDSRRHWVAVLERLGAPRALTVGGYAGFVADGGMIEIVLTDERARFDIHLGELRRAGLRLAPQLLQLARRVVE